MFQCLRSLFSRKRHDDQLDLELQSHIEMETEANLRHGMDPEDARRAALLAFGGVTQTAELCRDQRPFRLLETLARDLRFAARTALKSPGFTALAVGSLALGIGASTVIFCVLNAVLLRPLPYRDPGNLVLVRGQLSPIAPEPMPLGAPNAQELARNEIFEQAGIFLNVALDVSSGSNPLRVIGARLSAPAARLLGVAPERGRLFTDEEDRPSVRVALLSHDLWQRLGGDPGIVGKSVLVNRVSYQVCGVMPPGFMFPPPGMKWEKPAAIFVPLGLTPDELRVYGDNAAYGLIARLKREASLERANARLEMEAHTLQQRYPAKVLEQLPRNIQLHVMALPLKEQVVGGSRRELLILMASISFLLLIACVNVANMLLGRAWKRAPEIGLRLALGASRATLIAQLLTESMLLAAGGAALGIVFAAGAIQATSWWLPANLPRSGEIRLDWTALLFAICIALLATLIFGLVPALLSTRTDLERTLRAASRGSMSGTRAWSSALIVTEVALTVLLQSGAGLLIRSMLELRNRDANLRPAQVASVSLSLPRVAYRNSESVREFYARAMQNLAAIPGVLTTGAATSVPFGPGRQWVHTVEHRPGSTVLSDTIVSGNYFETFGIALRRGRLFNDDDRLESARVAIVNETAVREFWPGQYPIGNRVKWGVLQTPFPWMTIVGVVADVSQDAPDETIRPQIYEPFAQQEYPDREMNLAVLAAVPASTLTNSIQTVLRRIDPDLPLSRLATIEQARSDSLLPRRATMGIVSSLAMAALALASIGIYGVMMFMVTARGKEIAIRMVLGASRASVLNMVLGRGMLLVAIGSVLGVTASLAAGRFMTSMLYGVRATDLVAYLATLFVIATVALLALAIPARIASRADSSDALRHE